MALTTCRECDGKASTEALQCPHCGAPKPARRFGSGLYRQVSPATFLVAVVAALGMPFLFMSVLSSRHLGSNPVRPTTSKASEPTPSPGAPAVPLDFQPSPTSASAPSGSDPTVANLKYIREFLLKEGTITEETARFVEPLAPSRHIPTVLCAHDEVVLAGKAESGQTYLVVVESRPFARDLHRIDGPSAQYGPTMIDGAHFWGADGGIPSREIGTFRVAIDGMELPVPESAIRGLYEPNMCSVNGGSYVWAGESASGNHLFVYMEASDGAGAYCVKWVFSHSAYITRVILHYDLCEWIYQI